LRESPDRGLGSALYKKNIRRYSAMKVGNQQIMIPTTMVGNYPNPRWFDNLASFSHFSNYPYGDTIADTAEAEAFEDAMLALARDQERAGIDIICDGRLQAVDAYGRILYYYPERMTNYEPYGPLIGLPIYSRLYAPTCVGPIRRKVPMMVPVARALKKATDKPVKIQYTGVQVLAQATNDKYYNDRRKLAMDIAAAYNEDILELDEMGVEYIQIDEFTWPYIIEDWAIDAFNRAVEGVKNAKIVCHICFGNWGGTPGYYPDETAKAGEAYPIHQRKGESPKGAWSVVPRAYDAKIDILNIEFGRDRNIGDLNVFEKHPLPKSMDFFAGVLDVKSTITETAGEVAERINKVLQYIAPERLGVTTDCGLILLQRYVATEKLKALAAGTKLVRDGLAARKVA